MYENSNNMDEDKQGILNPELNQQELVDDLKNSLSKTIKDTSDLLDSIIRTLDQSIIDESTKSESKTLIKELRKNFSKTLNTTYKNNSSSVTNEQNKYQMIRHSEEE
ncbi:hypothetical protein N9E49_00215 [Acidimicrobiia bacterium]|nr:hypothetical protein [Acidimicrobiia bacterium]